MGEARVAITAATEADRGELAAYLAARSDTCMLLRSNLHAVGLAWSPPAGALLQAEYVIGRRAGAVIGVAAHAWNGNVLVQADEAAGPLAVAAVQRSGRQVAGLVGPLEQVREAREALGLAAVPARLDSAETLMALALDQLVVPPGLRGRRAAAADRSLLVAWRAAYLVETGQQGAGPATDALAATAIDSALAGQHAWVVERDGALAAMCMHNATLPDAVQVGGVFTPPALRNRGHARAVVAASLLDARAENKRRAILFTPRPDAIAAYRAVGFEAIGRYAIVLFNGRSIGR